MLKVLWILIAIPLMAQPKVTIPDRASDEYHYNVADSHTLHARIQYGIGELIVGPNSSSGEIAGKIQYNRKFIVPQVRLETRGETAEFFAVIEARDSLHNNISLNLKELNTIPDEYKNVIDFRLPTEVPTVLDMNFGLGKAEIDLSGIPISRMNLDCGLSDVGLVSFLPNPLECEMLHIATGLGDLTLQNLGNLQAKNIDLAVNLGSANVDFRGDRIIDTYLNVQVGLGALDMILPEAANISIVVDGTFLSSVSVYGLVKAHPNEWISPSWRPGLPAIRLDLDVGLGSVDVFVKE